VKSFFDLGPGISDTTWGCFGSTIADRRRLPGATTPLAKNIHWFH